MNLDLGIICPGADAPHGFLTNESPQSHYGFPVLRIAGVDYGPADPLPYPRPAVLRGHNLAWTGAAPVWLVCRFAGPENEYHRAGAAFLAQWPGGPQL
jgi:hypothetical protein